jgi:hypothetical protein
MSLKTTNWSRFDFAKMDARVRIPVRAVARVARLVKGNACHESP